MMGDIEHLLWEALLFSLAFLVVLAVADVFHREPSG